MASLVGMQESVGITEMSSFLDKLKNTLLVIGRDVLAAEPAINAIVTTINPAYGVAMIGIEGVVNVAILTAEKLLSGNTGQGTQKSSYVLSNVAAAAALISSIDGKNYSWDPAKLQVAIDAQVAAHNAMSDFIGTWKES